MIRPFRLTLALASAMLLAAPALAQEITLKVHHFWPSTAMGPSTLLAPWCERIGKDSGGRIKCQIYPCLLYTSPSPRDS